MLIDIHVHLGRDTVFESDFPEEPLLRALDEHGVDLSIVQPGTEVFLEPVRAQHEAIARLAARLPGRIVGMADPNPHLPEEAYRQEVTRCVRELGFVGIKLHTQGHAVRIDGRAAQMVCRVAQELDVAVMVHTAPGNAFTSPLGAIAVARANPRLRLVLAHAANAEALLAAQECPNITLETTWSNYGFAREAVHKLGASRVVFGSDHPANIPVELAKYRAAGLSEAQMELVLSGTARQVFGLR